jgi:periplasmic protein TonB
MRLSIAASAVVVLVLEAGAALAQNEPGVGTEGQATAGNNTTPRSAYLATLSKSIARMKVDPHSRQAGTVLVHFKVGPDGKLLSRTVEKSSGSKVLDDAAVATLDRAAPFPPVPQNLAPIEVSVPFEFATR